MEERKALKRYSRMAVIAVLEIWAGKVSAWSLEYVDELVLITNTEIVLDSAMEVIRSVLPDIVTNGSTFHHNLWMVHNFLQ